MATTEDKKESSQEVLDFSKAFGSKLPDFTIANGKATVEVDSEPYLEFMKEGGIDKTTLKKVYDLNTTFNAGVTHAVGHKAIDLFKSNNDISDVDANIKLDGRNSLGLNIKREIEVSAPGSDVKTKQYGVANVKLSTFAGRHKVGELGIVREQLKAAALAAYGE